MLILAVSAFVILSLAIFYWWFPSVPASLPSSSVPTAPPASLPSPSTARRCKYDVFLSFRGPDTRKSFTYELYYGLQNRGIRTFMDEEDIEKGDEISPTLLKAIEESWFAIIVLSKQYASSTWCLEELTKICQSMKDPNRILPVFYQVEPTDVRYQKRSFEEAFIKHDNSGRNIQEKVQQWRDALNKVASFSGWNSNEYKNDRQLLKHIVESVYSKVQPVEIKMRDFEAKKQELELKLLPANLLVDDAEEKQIRIPEVKEWLFRLKDIIYDARDLLGKINTEVLRHELEANGFGSCSSSSIYQVQNLYSTSMDEFEKLLEPRMDSILKMMTLIMDQKDALGLKAGDESWPKSRNRETTSLVDDSGVYGRDEDKETIKKLLLSDDATDEKIGVIPIVGMGGIGKTTLAQLLYKDVKHGFDLQAWVCVSEEFDILRVTQQIYGSITKSKCNIMQLDLLQVELREYLENKKFLLVLDDVWNENYNDWDNLKLCFSAGAFGSRIIVTTRNEGVASVMGTLQSHYLKEISEEDCWSIFAKHAFGSKANVMGTQHPDLVEIGRQIAKKCKGLPLSAKSLGGLMRCELNKKRWEMILQSDIWLTMKESDGILPALWISYRYLPSHLKRCFAYCSIFSKDDEFTKSDLILMWMAEDLLQPEEGKMMEEVGEDYFKTLISRSFFQLLPDGVGGGETYTVHVVGDDSVFCMHDLINDLAKYVSGEFCLRSDDKISPNHESKIRHFSCLRNSYEVEGDADSNEVEEADSNDLVALKKAKSLHTFIFFSNGFPYIYVQLPKVLCGLWKIWECLRLLNLSGCDVRELPSSIGNFKHLRHLNLSWTKIQELPETLCTLYNMQTLLLKRCPLVRLPTNLGRLIKLRHLDIMKSGIQKMPPHMGRLKDLQYLEKFEVSKDAGCTIAELKELRHLGGTLSIRGLKNIVSDKEALEANMRDKKNLKGLVLQWSEGEYKEQESSEGEYEELESSEGEYEEQERTNGVIESSEKEKQRQVLEHLQPHTNLKELELVNYWGTKFPSWVGDHSFNNLVSVKLVKCEFCFSLPPLGQLPSLEELDIIGLHGVESIGSEFYGNNTGGVQPFRSLEELRIYHMLEWKEWVYVGGDQEEESTIFPNLRDLRLIDCPKLTNTFPLDKIQNLEKVVLSGLKSFTGPLSQESECPKFISLTSLRIYDCPEFVRFSDGGGIDAPKLKSLRISYGCVKLGSLPERMHTLLPSLTELEIRYCPELESFPEGGLPPALKSLELRWNEKLFANRKQWGLPVLESLEDFTIQCGSESEVGSSFPEEGLLPANLTRLYLFGIPNLTSIDGKQLGYLNSLQKLWIYNCPKLECFPEEGLPTSLKELGIWNCPLLEERCERGNGQDWPKIAHISEIYVNNRRMRMDPLLANFL